MLTPTNGFTLIFVSIVFIKVLLKAVPLKSGLSINIIQLQTKWILLNLYDYLFICIKVPANEHNHASNHQQQLDCLFKSLLILTTIKQSKLRSTWPFWKESSDGFSPQRVNNVENVSMSWRHHDPNIDYFLIQCLLLSQPHTYVISCILLQLEEAYKVLSY